jgi:outer membrane protein assembly factor BamB
MKKNLIFISILVILACLHLQLNASTARKLIATLARKPAPVFFTAVDSGSGSQTQTAPQTQTQSQSQTRTQSQSQSQTQQTQTLYIGFPMKLTWKFNTNGPVIAQPQTDSAAVYCLSKPGTVYGVNQTDGKQIWKTNLGDSAEEAFLLKNDVLYEGTQRGFIFAVEKKKGKQLWNQKLEGESFLTMPAADETNIYFSGAQGTVVALKQGTGAFLWKFKTGSTCSTTPFLKNNTLFIGCDDHFLYAIDSAAGYVRWKFNAGYPVKGSPVADSEYVFVGNEDGIFYCLQASNGNLKWKLKTGGAIRGVPAFYTHKDETEPSEVLFAALDNFLYDIKIKNGGRKWLSPTASRVYNRMFFDRALIFVAPFGSHIYGFDPHTGQRVGEFSTSTRIRSSPITANDRLFIGLNNGNLLCLTRTPPPPPEDEDQQQASATQPAQQAPQSPNEETEPESESQSQTQTQTQ